MKIDQHEGLPRARLITSLAELAAKLRFFVGSAATVYMCAPVLLRGLIMLGNSAQLGGRELSIE